MQSRGVTLIELIVALAMLALVVGISGLALVSLRAPSESQAMRELQVAHAQAIRTGRPVLTPGHLTPDTGHRLFLPDGRAVGPGVDPLTGAVHAIR